MEVAAKLVVQERGSDPEVNPLRPRTAGMLGAVVLQVAKTAMLFPAALVIILIKKYFVYDLSDLFTFAFDPSNWTLFHRLSKLLYGIDVVSITGLL